MDDVIISRVGKYVTPLVRTGLAFVSGWLVTKGWFTVEDANALIGEATAVTFGVLGLVGTYGWSVWQKLNTDAAAGKLAQAATDSPTHTPVIAVKVSADIKPSAL